MHETECIIWKIQRGLHTAEDDSTFRKINKCNVCEMWFLRKMMKIPWTDKVCDKDALSRAQVKRKLLND